MNDKNVNKCRSFGTSRTVTVTSKFSESDLERIAPKLAVTRKSLSTFVRDAALGAKVEPKVDVPAINAEQWRELSRVAANLNQIAHRCNRETEHPGSGRVLAAIEATQAVLMEVRSTLLGAKGGTEG